MNELDNFYRQNRQKMNEPIIKKFLSMEENQVLLNKAINTKEPIHADKLNQAFSKYYRKVKILNYISMLIHYYSIDFDKKNSKNVKRQALVLDISPGVDKENKSPNNALLSSKEDLTYNACFEKNKNLQDHITDRTLYNAISKLSKKQVHILNLIYGSNYSNKEVADFLGESNQTISYNHRRALEILKEQIT